MPRSKCQFCCLLTDNVEKHEREDCAEARKKYVCKLDIDGRVCGRRFTNMRGLSSHQSAQHNAEERGTTHNCHLCSFGTFNQKSLDGHLRRHREGGFRSRSRPRGPSVPRFIDQSEENANRRSRSRSNSRPPARNARSRSNSRPPARNARSRSRSNARPLVRDARSRSNSRPPIAQSRSRNNSPSDANKPNTRTRRSKSKTAMEPSASTDNHQQQDDNIGLIENLIAASFPEIVDADGMYNLKLIDAEQAHAIIETCNQQLLHMVEEIKRSYEEAVVMCNRHGINISDTIRERIEKTMKVVLSPTGELTDEEGEQNVEGMEMNGY